MKGPKIVSKAVRGTKITTGGAKTVRLGRNLRGKGSGGR